MEGEGLSMSSDSRISEVLGPEADPYDIKLLGHFQTQEEKILSRAEEIGRELRQLSEGPKGPHTGDLMRMARKLDLRRELESMVQTLPPRVPDQTAPITPPFDPNLHDADDWCQDILREHGLLQGKHERYSEARVIPVTSPVSGTSFNLNLSGLTEPRLRYLLQCMKETEYLSSSTFIANRAK